MKVQFLQYKEKILSSFWFLPLILIILAIILAHYTTQLDEYAQSVNLWGINEKLNGSTDGYRAILSTIGSSMMTIAGIVFSSTFVAITLTYGQFGSRVIQNFLQDKFNQIVLGTYIATFIYTLMILRVVKPERFISYTPDISIIIAIILAIVNIALLVFFIHHIAYSIQVKNILSHLSDELSSDVKKLYPHDNKRNIKSENQRALKSITAAKSTSDLVADTGGYILSIDFDYIKEFAQNNDIFVEVLVTTGGFVLEGEKIITVYYKNHNQELSIEELKQSINITKQKSTLGNIDATITQIVDIACRALSPGVNDPFTAIACIDHLGYSISVLQKKELQYSKYVFDDNQNLLLIKNLTSFEEISELCFEQIIHYGKNAPKVLRHLSKILEGLIKVGTDDNKADIIRKYKDQCDKHLKAISY